MEIFAILTESLKTHIKTTNPRASGNQRNRLKQLDFSSELQLIGSYRHQNENENNWLFISRLLYTIPPFSSSAAARALSDSISTECAFRSLCCILLTEAKRNNFGLFEIYFTDT